MNGGLQDGGPAFLGPAAGAQSWFGGGGFERQFHG